MGAEEGSLSMGQRLTHRKPALTELSPNLYALHNSWGALHVECATSVPEPCRARCSSHPLPSHRPCDHVRACGLAWRPLLGTAEAMQTYIQEGGSTCGEDGE